MLMGSKAEVLDSLSGILGSSEEEGVASSGGSQCQLIQSQGFSTCSKDARTSGCGESESSNAELRNSQETVVIGDCANNDNIIFVGLLGGVANNSGNRDWRSVDAGHEKSAQNDLVEG